MRLALKPYVTTGVAIVGAGVIAVTPVTPSEPQAERHNVVLSAAVQNLDQADPAGTLPDVGAWSQTALPQLSAAAVPNGSSFVNPITRWIEVLGLTGTRLGQLGASVLAEPAPILRQIIENQIGYGRLIVTALQTTVQNARNLVTIYIPDIMKEAKAKFDAGDIMGVGNVLGNGMITVAATLFPLLDIMKVPNQMIGNLSAVMDAFTPKSFRDLGLIGQAGMGILYAASGYVKFGAARIGQNLYDAVQARDAVKLVSTIINAPADIVSGILNGVYVPPRRPGGTGYWTEGLLTAKAWAPLHAFLVDIPRAIAAAIKPRTATPPAATLRAPATPDGDQARADGEQGNEAAAAVDGAVTDPTVDTPDTTPVVVETPAAPETPQPAAPEADADPAPATGPDGDEAVADLESEDEIAGPGSATTKRPLLRIKVAAPGTVVKSARVAGERTSTPKPSASAPKAADRSTSDSAGNE